MDLRPRGSGFDGSIKITGANAGERLGFAGKSRLGLSARSGVAEFRRWAVSVDWR